MAGLAFRVRVRELDRYTPSFFSFCSLVRAKIAKALMQDLVNRSVRIYSMFRYVREKYSIYSMIHVTFLVTIRCCDHKLQLLCPGIYIAQFSMDFCH